MINGALYVIDTLSHRDSINVRFAPHLDPLSQYGNGSLLPASNATRTQLKDFVMKHQFFAGTSLDTVITDIFSAFLTAQNSQATRCHQVLILLISAELRLCRYPSAYFPDRQCLARDSAIADHHSASCPRVACGHIHLHTGRPYH